MSDIVVTVSKNFTHPASPGKKGLAAWLGEGDKPGDPWSGIEWAFSCGRTVPKIDAGERVYGVRGPAGRICSPDPRRSRRLRSRVPDPWWRRRGLHGLRADHGIHGLAIPLVESR